MPQPANDLPPGAPDYARGALANPAPLPGTVVPIFRPDGITQAQVDKDNASNAAIMGTAKNWLNRVISIFHPNPQQEHPLAPTERLLNRADSLEAQLDSLQRRSSPNGR
jgi:hypothetical protein